MSNNFEEYKKKITGFGEIEKKNGMKINGEIKMEKEDYQLGGYISLVLMYDKQEKKNSNFPFLCNI